jgi:hypothetical protein
MLCSHPIGVTVGQLHAACFSVSLNARMTMQVLGAKVRSFGGRFDF